MSGTINLIDWLARTGRKYDRLGLRREAAGCFSRLSATPGIAPEIKHEAQTRLAELHIARGSYTTARRHLAAALAARPGCAYPHYLMAIALQCSPRLDEHRALEHFRQAAELDQETPRYHSGHGLLAVKLGYSEEGLRSLQRALELAPDDPEILDEVLRGVEQEDREEARRILRAALFRHFRDSRFRRVWSDFHFRCLRAEQMENGQRYELDRGPIVLPFRRPASRASLGRIRRDAPSKPARPHFHLPVGDRKHA